MICDVKPSKTRSRLRSDGVLFKTCIDGEQRIHRRWSRMGYEGSGCMDIDLGHTFYFLHQYFNWILHRGLDVSSFLSLALSHVV